MSTTTETETLKVWLTRGKMQHRGGMLEERFHSIVMMKGINPEWEEPEGEHDHELILKKKSC